MYSVCLNEKFVDNQARDEFLQFMQKEFPNTKLIEVLDLIGWFFGINKICSTFLCKLVY
mgnify:FL=1